MFTKKFALLAFCFLVFISISSVCASDDSNMALLNNQSLADVSSGDVASFDDLQKDIKNLNPGDVYTMDKDYIFESDSPIDIPHPGICIGVDNVSINGNGHVIDGNYKSAIFTVTGNNVKIFNLTFINSKYMGLSIPVRSENTQDISHVIVKYTFDTSPLCWIGDNGLVNGCIFSRNTAINGAAVTWIGNNGVINNSLFIDNIARGIGGAVYMMMGANNTIANTVFRNSTSQLSGEAVYLDRRAANTVISNCTCDNEVFLIDGNFNGIDVDYLMYNYYSQIGDMWIDLVPVIYKAMMHGNVIIDDDLSGYAMVPFGGIGDFSLVLTRNFSEFDIKYQKEYIFTNIVLNKIYDSLIKDNYKIGASVTKSVNVTNKDEYVSVCSSTADKLIKSSFENTFLPDLQKLKKDSRMFDGVSYILNVSYAAGMLFISNTQWKTNNGFNVVNICGNGAKIIARCDDNDEYKWIETAENQIYIISDLTVEGFNSAIRNVGGFCSLTNVVLNNNKMDYTFKSDFGAAIYNTGVVVCNNCSFTNNYAKYGGAIYNMGMLTLDGCTFKGNDAYGRGDDVYNIKPGMVIIDGQIINESKGVVIQG